MSDETIQATAGAGDGTLRGRRVGILAGRGVEQVELTGPAEAVRAAGGEVAIISYGPGAEEGRFQAMESDWEKSDVFEVDVVAANAKPEDFDALVLPGGTLNSDAARIDADVVEFVRAFHGTGKPVAAICHAPWVLIDAGIACGRRMTSYIALKNDLINAGADWVDEELVVDGNLITSRNPGDLEAFCSAVVEAAANSGK
ncbi:type 1 glutamine amidotransferase domain-containing protein [Corynebacterium sp. 335C]